MKTLESYYAPMANVVVHDGGGNFVPGRGRIRWGLSKVNDGFNGVFQITQCTVVWYEGPNAPQPGPTLAHFIRLDGDYPEIIGRNLKGLCLAILQRQAAKAGRNPTAVSAEDATVEAFAAIVTKQQQEGLECDFEATSTTTKKGQEYVVVNWRGLSDEARPAAAAASPQDNPRAVKWPEPAPAPAPAPAPKPVPPALARLLGKPAPPTPREAAIAKLRAAYPSITDDDIAGCSDDQLIAAAESC